MKDQSSSVLEGEDVRWVLTVPAVWRQPAKQFMREAAYLVGTHMDESKHREVDMKEATNMFCSDLYC